MARRWAWLLAVGLVLGAFGVLLAMVLLTEEAGWTYRGGFLMFAVATAAVVAAVVSHPQGWLVFYFEFC